MNRLFLFDLARLRSLALALGLVALGAAPRIAEACAVCSAGREEATRTAFVVATAGMTALPFILVGGLVWFLRRRFIEAEKAELREDGREATS